MQLLLLVLCLGLVQCAPAPPPPPPPEEPPIFEDEPHLNPDNPLWNGWGLGQDRAWDRWAIFMNVRTKSAEAHGFVARTTPFYTDPNHPFYKTIPSPWDKVQNDPAHVDEYLKLHGTMVWINSWIVGSMVPAFNSRQGSQIWWGDTSLSQSVAWQRTGEPPSNNAIFFPEDHLDIHLAPNYDEIKKGMPNCMDVAKKRDDLERERLQRGKEAQERKKIPSNLPEAAWFTLPPDQNPNNQA